jgi:hypothetical protein
MSGIHPTVAYKALNPDNCNIQDHEYERAIDRFMERYMPGFPKSLLERDFDRWEVEPLGDCEVESEYVGESDHEVIFVIDNEGERHEFADESDAEYFADEQNEQAEESRYGFPWANNWCHYPDGDLTDEDLRAAGFTIALYTDSDGEQRRLCGIDGGGYSFHGAHFSKLCAIAHHRWGRPVMTEQGHRLIVFPERGQA